MFEILIGNRAVWVNGSDGECLGRFGVYGIDVHRPLHQQHLGECLDCTHGRVSRADWERFKTSMHVHHGVDLSGLATPEFANNIE